MKFFRRHRAAHDRSKDAGSTAALAVADYDAQSDLALPTAEHGVERGFVPFAGELAPEADAAGYDVARDVGIDPS